MRRRLKAVVGLLRIWVGVNSMNVNAAKLAVCFMMLLCFGASLPAQESGAQPNCSRVDKARAPLFITFDRVESNTALLRLHNNSRCAVLIPTNQLQASLKISRPTNGGLKVERMEELRDGGHSPVVYNLFNRRGFKDTVIVSDGCIVITRQLLPQQSVIFAVLLADFKKNADVAVEFKYFWEEDSGSAIGGEFGHYVFFRNEYLPQGVIR
jgi:hypothetical protein